MRRAPDLLPITLALSLLVPAASAHAGGYALSEQTAVAAGSGGASTARDDDAGAAWYNPAALADGRGLRVGAGVFAAFANVSATDMEGAWQTDSEGGVKTPASLQVAFAQGSWATGVALGVPFGGGIAWPDDWEGRHEIRSSQITVLRAAPFFAWSFGRIRVAAGPHVDSARLRIVRGLDFIAEEGDVDIALDGWGVGAHAAVFAAVRPDLDLGLTYKSRTTIGLDGVADFDAPLAFSVKTTDQLASSKLTLPDRLALGARFQRGALSLLGDVEVTLWSVNKATVIDFERDETPDARQENNWSTTVSARLGAELEVRDGPLQTIARVGAFFDPSPVSSENLAPSSPDANRLGATLGVSQALPQDLHVDAFYELLHLLSRESTSMESISARYSGRAHFIGFGLRWQP